MREEQTPGPREYYSAVGPSWAWAQNTPFRRYKTWMYEGGIATPMIVRYPKITPSDAVSHDVGHIIDLLPTCIDLAGTTYPAAHAGNVITPVAGRSLKPVFAGKLADILTARGAEKRLTIPADLARKLASASPEALAGNLPELADAWQGQVDVLIVADIDSDYASRAGTHRRWYEASGRVKTFDVWTGKELSTYEDTVTASGIGESRADRAARIRLADALAARLLAARP